MCLRGGFCHRPSPGNGAWVSRWDFLAWWSPFGSKHALAGNAPGLLLALQGFNQGQCEGNGAACAGAGNQTAVTDDGGICGHVCIAHLILAAGIAGGIPAVGNAQVCQDGRAGADGGNEPAVVPGPLQGIQGGLTGPGTGNAVEPSPAIVC